MTRTRKIRRPDERKYVRNRYQCIKCGRIIEGNFLRSLPCKRCGGVIRGLGGKDRM